MPRFFSESMIAENARVSLDARASQHVRVLRLREGDAISLFDGTGGEMPATIAEIGKRDVWVETSAHVSVERELARRMTLCVGLIANDRFDWLIQKATELGVAQIQPLYTERSQRIPGDVEKRIAHWRGVAIAACEQCGRNLIPAIAAPMPLSSAVAAQSASFSVLMDAEGDRVFSERALSNEVTIFIGPEGGFALAELETLRAMCQRRLRVGETVLRAETAAIAAIVTIGA